MNEVILDSETTGLRWWRDDKPVGLAVGTRDGRSWYLPTAHAGGNLDESTVQRWAREQLRGKRIIGFNVGFDIHMTRVWGVDLEALGCTVSDVSHYAALLDDHRKEFSLDAVSKDLLKLGKLEGIDVREMIHYHAADVAPYAKRDVLLTGGLLDKMEPLLSEQGLDRVKQLEDEVIFVTCEMEKNGAPLDEEKLNKWRTDTKREYERCCWDLYKEVGFRVDPKKPGNLHKLFEKLHLPLPMDDDGKVTFDAAHLRAYDHPQIKLLRKARKLASRDSKFLTNYWNEIQRNGLLRYSLNQLRKEEGGTVSGRYSSSGYRTDPREGINIQQVAGKKEAAGSLKDLSEEELQVIRELFIPGSGMWLSADASQIEYRLFAHFAQPPKVLAAYAEDPNVDYHNLVMDMVRHVRKDISRPQTKDLNFAKLYGAGEEKIALMLGISIHEARPFIRAYDSAFPEAHKLLRKASKLAESRGYVKTLLGRRARFHRGEFSHAALNRVIQGTAADVNKKKLVELHRAKKETGLLLRFTVHDEACGDVPDAEAARKVREVLNRQTYDEDWGLDQDHRLLVPILWNVGTGPDWANCHEEKA